MVDPKQDRNNNQNLSFHVTPNGVLSVSFTGRLALDNVAATLPLLDLVVRAESDPLVAMIDAQHLAGYDPGLPARGIKWFARHATEGRFAGAVIVTSNPTLHAIARAAQVLVPSVPVVSVATRAEAHDLISRWLTRVRRLRTDEHTVVRNPHNVLARRKQQAG